MKLARYAVLLVSLFTLPATAAPLLDVYLGPRCGCCSDWVTYMEEQGFETKSTEMKPADVFPTKKKARIPEGKESCHTAFIDGYSIEGHVPAEDVKRLLEQRPDAVGLTVPGMPIGSPGMEMGDRKDPYEVLLINNDGSTEVVSRHNYPPAY